MHLAIGQQVRHVVLEQFGEVGREHGRGIDHRITLQCGFLLQGGVDPGSRQSEGRLDGVNAGHPDLISGGVHHHELVRPDLARACIYFLDLDDVGVGFQLHIVENAYRRHHKAHLDRERAAQRLDLLGQAVGAVGAIHQRQQRIAEFDLEIVDLQRGCNRLFPRSICRRSRGWSRRLDGLGLRGSAMPGSSASTSITPADMPSACG